MHSFKDAKGRTWEIEVTNASIKRVRGLLGFDLRSLIENGARGFGEFIDDDIRVGETIYALCKPRADADNITSEDFEDGLKGDANRDMTTALAEEYIDFFKDQSVRNLLRRMLAKANEISEASRAEWEKAVEEVEKKTPAELLKQIAGSPLPKSSDSPSTPPANLDSTLALSPSTS